MIYITNTPNNAGVAIHGDYLDFEELYATLHSIVGEDGESSLYEAARLRVLGVCYDLRHAIMGDREIVFVDNGMDEDKMKRMSTITHNKNIYMVINVLWPEILFVTMVLNDFILLNRQKCNHPQWDKATATVRKLQVAVTECIKQTVPEPSNERMINMMIREFTWFSGYATQYLDLLNSRFLDMNKEERLKNISTMAKYLAEQNQEYKDIKSQVIEMAKTHNCPVEDIRLKIENLDDFDW